MTTRDLTQRIGEELASSTGLTDFELAARLSEPVTAVNDALRRLSKAQCIYDCKERKLGPSGKRSLVWYAMSGVDFSQPLPAAPRSMPSRSRKETVRMKRTREEIQSKLLGCVETVARSQLFFTADDVRDVFDRVGDFGLCDPRATGPAMIRAMKLGYCCKTDRTVVSTRRQSGLANVFRSLIHPDSHRVDLDSLESLRARVLELEQENARLRGSINVSTRSG